MKRRVFNLFSLLSLLMCAAMLVMWVRSYRVGERWAVRRDVTTSGVSRLFRGTADSTRGCVEIIFQSGSATSPGANESFARYSSGRAYVMPFQDKDDTRLERLGLRWLSGDCQGNRILGQVLYRGTDVSPPTLVSAAAGGFGSWPSRRMRLPCGDCHQIHGKHTSDGRDLYINFPYRWPTLLLAMLPWRWQVLRGRRLRAARSATQNP